MADAQNAKIISFSDIQFAREDEEIKDLLESIFQLYGYDFRGYSRTHLRRRILRRMMLANLASVSALQMQIKKDPILFESLLGDFSICVTEMFRDPSFFAALRKDVLPYLATQPFIKIWVAGCATGEEVYSLAILLEEAGIYERSLIYATDINATALKVAQDGVFNIKEIRTYTENYQKAGFSKPFVNYYTAASGLARFNDRLKKNILFSHHNLVTDGSFGEMHLILCRNVLIYFDRSLQNRVFKLFQDSLCHQGFLGIGSKETLRFSNHAGDFEEWVLGENIYRRVD